MKKINKQNFHMEVTSGYIMKLIKQTIENIKTNKQGEKKDVHRNGEVATDSTSRRCDLLL